VSTAHESAPSPPPSTKRLRAFGGRIYPPAKVGDVFGDHVVLELLPRDRTSNELVRVRCKCGRERSAYMFNVRKVPECRHRGRPVRTRVDRSANDLGEVLQEQDRLDILDRRVTDRAYCRVLHSVWRAVAEGRRWRAPCWKRGATGYASCTLAAEHDGDCVGPGRRNR
jgi:hypothetical protein